MTSAAQLLPNIRRLFIPDPSHIVLDCDLSGADAQVVAWEAEDEDLKSAFRSGLKIHEKNATDMWGDEYTGIAEKFLKERKYDESKRAVHAFNYLGSPRTVAVTLGWTIAQATAFQRRWFTLHPGIPTWHGRIEDSLERHRGVENKFGFRIRYLDRIESVVSEAVAWIPQSTVAHTCFIGAIQVEDQLPWVQILLQVHDSLVLQIPRSRLPDILLIRDALLNTIPYNDPLVIPWGVAISPKSWGDVEKMSWEEAKELRL